MSFLEDLGFEALKSNAQAYLRGITNEIKQHVTKEVDRLMSDISDANEAMLAAHDAAIATEMQQVKDAVSTGLANVQTAVDNLAVSEEEKAALQAALDTAKAETAAVMARVGAGTATLASDDAPPV